MQYEFRGRSLEEALGKAINGGNLRHKGVRNAYLVAKPNNWSRWLEVYDIGRDGGNVRPNSSGTYVYTVDIRIQTTSHLPTTFDVEFDEFGSSNFQPNFSGLHRVQKTYAPDPDTETTVQPYRPSPYHGQIKAACLYVESGIPMRVIS